MIESADIIVITSEPENEISRSVTLTNEEWTILAMSMDAYADTYRVKHSQTVATYVTRGQLIEAQSEATRMNLLLQKLDKIQAKLF